MKDFKFSQEERFIISLLRKEELKENIDKIDWMNFLEIAKSEGIYPLLYKYIKDKDYIPEKIKKILKFFYEKNKEKVDFLKKNTIFVLKILKENGIDAIPLKGFILAEKVYKSLYSRTFTDIDIFVFKKDVFKVIKILKQKGFSFNVSEEEEKFLKKFHFKFYNEYKLYKENLILEIHFDLLPKRFKIKKNFEKSLEFEKEKIEDFEFKKLSKEWDIIFISVHAFLHRFSLLKFLFDIHKYIENFKDEIDFKKIYEIGRDFKILKITKLSLTLSSFLFGTKIPSFLKFKNLPEFIIRDFIFKKEDPLSYKKDLFSLLFINSLSERIYYTISLLNPDEKTFKTLPLPDSLFFLYYPLRLLLILKNRLFFIKIWIFLIFYNIIIYISIFKLK